MDGPPDGDRSARRVERRGLPLHEGHDERWARVRDRGVLMERRGLVPFVAATLGLCGSLAVTLALYAAARDAVDRVLHERLAGAGESAASLLAGTLPMPTRLLDVMRANDLDGAYVLSRTLRVVADANGTTGRRADLLRVDAERLRSAFGGTSSVGHGYALGDLVVLEQATFRSEGRIELSRASSSSRLVKDSSRHARASLAR